MRRKILLLNVALAGASIYAGLRVRDGLRAANQRESAELARRAAATPQPPLPALPAVPPVLPVDYADVAQKMLLDKSRNSTVIVETPPAPPPKVMPAMPFYHGQMRLPGESPTVILSATSGGAQQEVHPGESIGEFKLLAANSQELTFEWDGKKVSKSLDELLDHGAPAQAAAAAAPAARPLVAPPPAPEAPKSAMGPGKDINPEVKACVANDSYEDGAVVDGYRKSVVRSPFGVACQWLKID
ncbi:MAG TPA: hypothetical protein VMU19_00255 [Bryobacteraceae bacterium]|nr:hypothetical protein [Bryobacteraceae bacterium]